MKRGPNLKKPDPLERARSHGDLAPGDIVENDRLYLVGCDYRSLHVAAGLAVDAAMDHAGRFEGKVTRPPRGMRLVLDKATPAVAARVHLDRIHAAMLPEIRTALEQIVVLGLPPGEVGAKLVHYTDGKIRAALAMTFLRIGLRQLSEALGLEGSLAA